VTDSSEARVMHLTENATVVEDIHLNLESASQMLMETAQQRRPTFAG